MAGDYPTGRLQDRVAIITGSSSGLGRAIAFLFASEGARCFLVDKYVAPRNSINKETGKADDWNIRARSGHDDNEEIEQVKQMLSVDEARKEIETPSKSTCSILKSCIGAERVEFHRADLTKEEEVSQAIEACVDRFSRLDILVNSHGISVESTHSRPLRCHETSLSDFELTQSINATSVFLTCKYALRQFLPPDNAAPESNNATAGSSGPQREQDREPKQEEPRKGRGQQQIHRHGRGWIVNISSVQGLTPYYATSSYCASKGAVVMLTRQIALDYAADGIRCNTVCPGFLNTDMTRNLQGDSSVLSTVAARQPLNVLSPTESRLPTETKGNLGKVSDVARMVLVLAGDDAHWMTGQAVVVDGGYTLT